MEPYSLLDNQSLASCSDCPLNGSQPVFSYFTDEEIDVLVIGQSPGHAEITNSRPFIGRSGELVNNIIHKYTKKIGYINSLNCRPFDSSIGKDRPPASAELKCCRERLIADIEYAVDGLEPEVIFVFGAVAKKEYNRLLKKRPELENVITYKMDHPSYILRNEHMLKPYINSLHNSLKSVFSTENTDVEKSFFEYNNNMKFNFLEDCKNANGVGTDIETNGLDVFADDFFIGTFGITCEEKSYFFDFRKPEYFDVDGNWLGTKKEHVNDFRECEPLMQVLKDKSIQKIFANIMYDVVALNYAGVEVNNITDLFPLASIYDNTHLNYSLEAICMRYMPEYAAYKSKFKLNLIDQNYMAVDKENLKIYNCLHFKNKILTEDGFKCIGDVVKDKYSGKVKSYNTKLKKFEYKQIVGWHKQVVKNQDWIIIKSKYFSSINRGLMVTPEHKIYTNRGVIRADSVVKSDKILIDEYHFTNQEYQVIVGSVLGDGCLYGRNNKKVGFINSQTCKQLVEEKSRYLSNRKFSLSEIIRKNHKSKYEYNKRAKNIYTLSLSYMFQLVELRNKIYKEKFKNIDNKLLNSLDSLGIAMWYMDDGGVAKNNQGNCSSCKLALQGFDNKSKITIKNWFYKKFGKCTLYNTGNLSLSKSASIKFSKYIGKHVVESMRYKLVDNSVKYVKQVVATSKQMYYVPIENVKKYKRTNKRHNLENTRYCITVKDNHNFMTTHGIVRNCFDSWSTKMLYDMLYVKLKSITRTLFNTVYIPLLSSLVEVKCTGMNINQELFGTYVKNFENRYQEICRFLDSKYGITNINSTPQIKKWFFKDLKLKSIRKTKTGGQSTDKKVIEFYSEKVPDVKLLYEARRYTSLLTYFMPAIKANIDRFGLIHPNYKHYGILSGRISCRAPNLQGIPRDKTKIEVLDANPLRRMFVSRSDDSFILEFDYSQQEVRIVAFLSQDPSMIKAFNDGLDIHRFVATFIFNKKYEDISEFERQVAKGCVFGSIFGVSSRELADTLKVSVKAAESYIQKFFMKFPRVKLYIDTQGNDAVTKGEVVSILGMPRKFVFNGKNEKDIRREGANHQIQSVGAVFTFLSLNKIRERLRNDGLLNNGVLMIHSVHDSIMFDVERIHIPYVIEVVRSIMIAVPPSIGFKIAYPVDYKLGRAWGEDLKLDDVLNGQLVG